MRNLGGTEARRAQRLACWYPKAWRERYGDEFEAMLAEQLKSQPHSNRRVLDIVSAGLRARLNYSGLVGDALPPRETISAGLGWLAFRDGGIRLFSVRPSTTDDAHFPRTERCPPQR